MSIIDNQLAGKRALVTGATGFIGSHLAQRLVENESAIVTGTGRNVAAAAFLEPFGVDVQKADLTVRSEMERVIAGQEVIFHVGASLNPDPNAFDIMRKVNVAAVREIVEIAAQQEPKPRIVLVSSIAAYGPPQKILMDEFTPVDPNQPEAYGKTKAMGELVAIEAGEKYGVDVTIVRPGMVYGARSSSWTVGMFKLVKKGVPTLFGKADGNAFPVYVGNLCDMLILAAVKPEAIGEAFNAVDDPVDWNEWFGYFGRMANRKPRRIPLPLAKLVVALNNRFDLGVRLNEDRLKFYTTKTVYPYKKAAEKLGFSPRVSIEEGMQISEQWLRENGFA